MPSLGVLSIVKAVLFEWQVWVGALVFLGSALIIRQVTKFDKKPTIRVKLPEEKAQPSTPPAPAPSEEKGQEA